MTEDILDKYAKLKAEYDALKVQYENAKCEIYLLQRLPRSEPILGDEEEEGEYDGAKEYAR